LVRPGDVLEIRALKADGHAYRWWHGTVESVDSEQLVTISPVGHRVEGPKGGWISRFDVRAVYWFQRPYNLTELYMPGGRLKQVYVNIASPAELEDGVLRYTDHELDVVWRPGQRPRVMDEGEFCAAAAEYGYSPELQKRCRRAVGQALRLIRGWKPLGPPRGQSRSARTVTPATDSSTVSTEV
jgi:protein associated with RNAse G/E